MGQPGVMAWMDRMNGIAVTGAMDAGLRRHDGYWVPETRRLMGAAFRGQCSAGRAQAMTVADAGTQTDVAMGCLLVIDGAGDGFAIGDQVSKRLSAPRPGVLRCAFCSHCPCPRHGGLWRARWPGDYPE